MVNKKSKFLDSKLYKAASVDHQVICDVVRANTKILDLGCGDGTLMLLLKKLKNAKVQGVELGEEAIYKCVEKGLHVFHSDIDGGLIEYPDNSFDYVILNESMQEIKNVEYVLNEALRVGESVIVGFPNFAHIRARFQLFFKEITPVTKSMPYKWYNTPNLHFLTIRDFIDFCNEKNVIIETEFFINKKQKVTILPSLFATNAIFVIKKG